MGLRAIQISGIEVHQSYYRADSATSAIKCILLLLTRGGNEFCYSDLEIVLCCTSLFSASLGNLSKRIDSYNPMPCCIAIKQKNAYLIMNTVSLHCLIL